jgi:hypothetical protein
MTEHVQAWGQGCLGWLTLYFPFATELVVTTCSSTQSDAQLVCKYELAGPQALQSTAKGQKEGALLVTTWPPNPRRREHREVAARTV